MDIDALRTEAGTFTVAHARAKGFTRKQLSQLAQQGKIARLARGLYTFGHRDPSALDPRALGLDENAAVSYESGAAWLGADLPRPPDRLHVTVPRNRKLRKHEIPGVRIHRARSRPGDLVVVRGVRVTSPLRTALDLARHASLEDAVAIIDSLMRSRLLHPKEFAVAVGRAQGPGRCRMQQVAALVDPYSGSILESRTRVLLWRRHLPTPRSQFPLENQAGEFIGYLDFVWEEVKASLECDGYEYHRGDASFQHDRRRWSAITSAGWRVVVVTWYDVTRDPDYVVALVRNLLSLKVTPALVAADGSVRGAARHPRHTNDAGVTPRPSI